MQASIFGQTWTGFVVGQLMPLARNTPPMSGAAFTNKFDVLLRQATSIDPRLYRCFRITPYQIRYRSKDNRYVVTIQQRECGEGVQMIWQFSTRRAGMNSVSFLVTPAGFVPQAEMLSPACAEDLCLLAEAGGELLGHLASRDLLPEDSLCSKAVEMHIFTTATVREEMQRQIA